MKVSENWLREWVELDATTEEIAHQLIMSGTELDGIDPVASNFTDVRVGQIKSIEQHPDADRLTVCQVDIGSEELLQIVTNASVQLEQKVPVAMIGAILPSTDDQEKPLKIKKGKLRGVLSQGMFCGTETLGMGEGGEGLLSIPVDAELGKNLRDIFDLNDVVLDLDATPNRADLLSVAGVSRELGVIMQAPVKAIEIQETNIDHNETFPVKITADDLCHRYVGRIIKDVNVKAKTPDWMVEKLLRSGIRDLSPVVDVTNYVMLELGQPMHGFDFDKLSGGINVRRAVEGENQALLNGTTTTLKADTLVIADEVQSQGLAGIMGSDDSSVTDDTTNIYLESAFFLPEKIMGKARQYGLHTESSHRFERGVSPDLQVKAMQRATQLITEICGGKVGPITDVVADNDLQQRNDILFERHCIKRHLGIDVDASRVEDILSRLGCELTVNDSGWIVTPPIFRFDLATPEDLVEEVARIYGYDKIPARLRPMEPIIAIKEETHVEEQSLRNILVSRGYQEAITYSFVPPSVESLLSPASESIRLTNPISEELSIMRGTLWSGLLPAIDKNVKRQQNRVRFFETGLSFLKDDTGLTQRKKIAGAITGNLYSERWNTPTKPVDFFDIKGDVEALLAQASEQNFEFIRSKHKALHPGQSADIFSNGVLVGVCGALHPAVEKELNLDQQVFVFELDIDLMSKKKLPEYTKISAYPSVRRDLALVVNEEVTYSDIIKLLKNMNIKELVDIFVFDVYVGTNIDSGQKSIALGLIFQEFSRTLEEQEISVHVGKIMETLEKQIDAVLR